MGGFMKKLIALLAVSLFCTAGFSADLRHLKIRLLNVDYDGSQGFAEASVLDAALGSTTIETNGYHLDVSKLDGVMTFDKGDTKIMLNDIENGVFGSLGVLRISNLNLDYINTGMLALNFDSVAMQAGDGVHQMGKLDLKCKSTSTRNGDIFSFLTPCTEYGVLYMPEFLFSPESGKSMVEAFSIDEFEQMYIAEGHKITVKGLLPDRIKDLLINIKDNNFTINGVVKILFNLKLKGNGSIKYHEQSAELEVHLDKIKVGIIGITGTVLKKLKEAKLKNVRVSGDSIFIKI
jgi:hypothetical protein